MRAKRPPIAQALQTDGDQQAIVCESRRHDGNGFTQRDRRSACARGAKPDCLFTNRQTRDLVDRNDLVDRARVLAGRATTSWTVALATITSKVGTVMTSLREGRALMYFKGKPAKIPMSPISRTSSMMTPAAISLTLG